MVDITGTGVGLPIWIFIVAGLVAAFVIIFVWMIYHFIWPMRNSFARHIVKAKRENKPVLFLDGGKFFRCIVPETKVGDEKAQIYRSGQDVIKAGSVGGMKYCEGVLMGVGEEFRSLIANVAIIDLMDMLKKKDWDSEEVNRLLKKLSEDLRIELGYVDGGKILQERYKDRVAEINSRYDHAIARVAEGNGYPRAAPGLEDIPDNSEEETDGQEQSERKDD